MDRSDRIALAVVSFLTVFILGSVSLALTDAGWFRNDTKIEYRIHTVKTPVPYPSPSPVVEYVEVPTGTVTEVIKVPVGNCADALEVADDLARSVRQGNYLDAEAEAATYISYRGLC